MPLVILEDGTSWQNLTYYPKGAAATQVSTLIEKNMQQYIPESIFVEEAIQRVGAENVFGFTATDDNGDPLYPYAQSWEFAENKYAPCKFLTDPDEIPDGDGDDNNPGWEKCFEDRYKSKERGMDDFKALYRWVYSTNQKLADGSKLDGDGYVGVDGTVYTHDTKEYRLAKFRKEFEEHFNLNFTLVYYVYTFVMLMVDQRAKNQFLTSWDGQIWHPWLYDNDKNFFILSL
jgi:hypothetical protein